MPTRFPDVEMTDVMIAVSDLPSALSFWMGTMGFERAGEGADDWVMLEDPRSGQQISLVAGDFGVQWATAVATDSLAKASQRLIGAGARPVKREELPNGFAYAVFEAPGGGNILLYER